MIGLDKQDNVILEMLDKKSSHPSRIARELGIKRTTITYRLHRLRKFGLIEPTITGRKTVYKLSFKKIGVKNHIQTFSGRDIINAYRQLLDLPKHSIIMSVQGSGAVMGEFKNLPQSFITKAHDVFKRKGIVLKGFSNEKAFKTFDTLNKSLVQSHIGRTLGLKTFNNGLFTCKGEIMVTNKLLLLANPADKKVILIKDREIVQIIHDIFALLFELLDDTSSFDLNSYLQETYFSKLKG